MNVLFLMVDEMAPWGCGPSVNTPHIDALRARGMDFTAAYTPSPICVPARASVATGKYVHEIGYWSSAEAYDGAVPSWAHQTRAAGIETLSFGKLHYRNGDDDTGFTRQVEPLHIPGGTGWAQAVLRRPLCEYTATRELAEEIGPGATAYHAFDERVASEAADWLAAPARKDAPWCAFVSFLSPHYPLIAPQEDYDLYPVHSRPAESVPDHPVLREMWEFWDHDRYFDDETRGIAYASYQALCTFVDRQIGQVMDALAASGQTDDTLVIFTSDHGDMMGQHGFWVKSVMYESSARVPLIMAGPGVGHGTCDAPVSLIDIAPTIARAFGLSEDTYSGLALQSPDPDREVLSEYHDGGSPVGLTMLRWNDGPERWKYVQYAEGHQPQLFELGADPDERADLSAARPDMLAEAQTRLAGQLDPEAVNARAHADQVVRMEELGGRAVLEAIPQWNYTPADSR